MDILTILKDAFRCKSIQDFVNHRFKDDNILRIYKNKYIQNIKYVVTKEGLVFKNTPLINNIVAVQYNYEDLLPDDVVLVLGACEGDCLVFANKVKQIIAIEPLHYEILKENIARNHITNVSVYEFGLGEGIAALEYEGVTKIAQLYSLTELVIRSGLRPTVLICDVQGYEHYITKKELQQFRIIEMETHVFKDYTLEDMKQKIQDAGFDYYVDENYITSEVMHATREVKT